MNTTEEYQIETLRRRFADRGYQPLNRRRLLVEHYIGYGLIIAALIIAAIPAILLTIL